MGDTVVLWPIDGRWEFSRTSIARTVRVLALERSRAPGAELAADELHAADLRLGQRLAAASAVLRGRPRRADVWIARYLRLQTGIELLLFELGSRCERRAHSQLPLSLADALALADELEAAAGKP